METREFILSGVLELYVLGKLDAREIAEVERMAAQYPEVRAEITAIEQALEIYAQMHGQMPPQGTLAEVLNRVDKLRPTTSTQTGARTAARSSSFLFIFVLLAALVSILAALWSYNGKQKTEAQIAGLQSRLDSIQNDCRTTLQENVANRAELAFLKDGSTKAIIMSGKTPGKVLDALATVYVNPSQGKAYLNVVNLPPAPAGKQYQLWAIVGTNAPTDMGVFDLPREAGILKDLPYRTEFSGAVTFAVTLEDAGGKPTPDLAQLYLIS